MQLVLLSGLSGAGKSVALKVLEDDGFFAVDNLPPQLIPALLESASNEKLAVSVDVRGGAAVTALPQIVRDMAAKAIDCRVIFLDANDDALTRRFAETRRPHPLADRVEGGVLACIAAERRMLADVAELGHRIDTSGTSPNTLRGWIRDWLTVDRSRITITFQSFGFKHGIPMDADLVFDARILPNPFYDPALRDLTGRDAPVKAFLEGDLNVAHFVDDIASFVLRWLPSFARDNRVALSIAIGCTGGQHRSVYIVEELAQRFGSNQQVLVRHRDMVASAK